MNLYLRLNDSLQDQCYSKHGKRTTGRERKGKDADAYKRKTWHQEQNLPVVVLISTDLFTKVLAPGEMDPSMDSNIARR